MTADKTTWQQIVKRCLTPMGIEPMQLDDDDDGDLDLASSLLRNNYSVLV